MFLLALRAVYRAGAGVREVDADEADEVVDVWERLTSEADEGAGGAGLEEEESGGGGARDGVRVGGEGESSGNDGRLRFLTSAPPTAACATSCASTGSAAAAGGKGEPSHGGT